MTDKKFFIFILFFGMGLAGCANLAARKAPPELVFFSKDSEKIQLSELVKNSDGLVLISHRSECPIVRRYSATISKLKAAQAGNNIKIYYINSSEENHLELVKKFENEYGGGVEVLFDRNLDFSKAFGAERTSEAVVLNKRLDVVYQGAIDDRFSYESEKTPQNFYLQDAISAILSGRHPKTNRTQASGCIIE